MNNTTKMAENVVAIATIYRIGVEITKRQRATKKDDKLLETICKRLEANGVIANAEQLFAELCK